MRILSAVTKRGSGNANRPRAAHGMLAGGQWWSMGLLVLALLNRMRVKCDQQQLKRKQSKSKLKTRILTSVTKRCSRDMMVGGQWTRREE